MNEQIGPNPEFRRRAELRWNALVPIYFMVTPDVPRPEANAALQGVRDVMVASGQDRTLVNFGSRSFGNGPYQSPNWYINEAFRRQGLRRDAGHGMQIDVGEIVPLFGEEPWQENPHWEVFVVGKDLNSRGFDGNYINFVFGTTYPDFAASVQSVRRIIDGVPAGPLRQEMIRRLLRHEVGHMFWLPSRSERTTQSLGKHCTNICTMRQGLSLEEWRDQLHEETRHNVMFCNDCMGDLRRIKPHYRPL